jgi:hypothetical protein
MCQKPSACFGLCMGLPVPSLPLIAIHMTAEGAIGSRGSCGEWCPSAFNSFELPSWMLYQDVRLLWDSGLGRGESSYSSSILVGDVV